MERSNRHYDTKFDLTISTSDLTTLSAYDAIKTFFNNQNLIDGSVVLNFIEKVKQSIFDSNYTNFAGGISYWQIEINETIHGLLKALEGFLNEMSKFTDYGAPYNLLFFDWNNMSTGEKAYLNFFSRFYEAKLQILQKLNNPTFQGNPYQLPETIYLLIDEGEIGFHLSWQQKFVQFMHTLLPPIFSFQDHTVKIQLIFTTHSPISLSDIPNDHIVYLRNGTVDHKVRKTFGANISELIADSFYFSNGLLGDFVKEKINQTIEWLNNEKDDSNYDYHQKFIELIDEPIIQRKLAEMYSEKSKSPFSKKIAIEQIDKQIRELNAKKDSLKSDGL